MDRLELINLNKELSKNGEKFCNGCEKTLKFEDFVIDNKKYDGRRSKCKNCRNKRRQQNRINKNEKFIKYENLLEVKRKNRCHSFKRQYGITLETFEKMLKSQNFVCKICKKPESRRHKKIYQ